MRSTFSTVFQTEDSQSLTEYICTEPCANSVQCISHRLNSIPFYRELHAIPMGPSSGLFCQASPAKCYQSVIAQRTSPQYFRGQGHA
jgi:hypothetical protein